MGLPVKISASQSCITVCHMRISHALMINRCPTLSSQVHPCRLQYYWSYVSTRTARPVAWLTHDGTGLRFHLRRSYQSVRSFLLPTDGADAFRFRDLQVKLLPKVAFFALWDTPILGTPALISEYQTEEDTSHGEDPGGPFCY